MTAIQSAAATLAAFILAGALASAAAAETGTEGSGGQEQARDPLLAARFAAVDGKFEECAKLADEARRKPDAVWQAHNVFATCEVFAADAVRDEIGPEAYVKRIEAALGAFRFLLASPGVLVAEDRRNSIGFMIVELEKRIASAQPQPQSDSQP